jgi:hypothetical protein
VDSDRGQCVCVPVGVDPPMMQMSSPPACLLVSRVSWGAYSGLLTTREEASRWLRQRPADVPAGSLPRNSRAVLVNALSTRATGMCWISPDNRGTSHAARSVRRSVIHPQPATKDSLRVTVGDATYLSPTTVDLPCPLCPGTLNAGVAADVDRTVTRRGPRKAATSRVRSAIRDGFDVPQPPTPHKQPEGVRL